MKLEYGITKGQIGCYPWNTNNYMPKTEFSLCRSESGLHLIFKSYEEKIVVRNLKYNSNVFEDSCVEFFFKPNPDCDDRYLNFEVNAAGVLLLGIGCSRLNRRLISDISPGIFGIRSSVDILSINFYEGPAWTIEYLIPYQFITEFFGKIHFVKGYHMSGNFYKCGDKTQYPHYGCWNPIKKDVPDFHRPECFGSLVL